MSVPIEQIYIQLLDGTTVLVPVNAIKLLNNQYEILDDKEFTGYFDSSDIYEFYPGDIVELEQHKFSDGKTGLVATKLINIGQWSDRKFNEFRFKATLGQLKVNKQTADKYRDEISRILKQKSSGQFIYPDLLNTIDKLTVFLIDKEEV